jgi:hypothetical protein
MSRYPEEWGKALEAAGLQTGEGIAKAKASGQESGESKRKSAPADLERAAAASSFANGDTYADDLAPEFEIADSYQDARVTQQQMRAIVLSIHGGLTQQQIAEEVGAGYSTVRQWLTRDPAVQAVRRELELEVVQRVQGAYLSILSETTRAQVLLAREVRKAARGTVDPDTGERLGWDPENLGRLARAATTIGADAADRAGFPKTSIQQHQLREADPDADLDGMSLDELEAEAQRLSRLRTGLQVNVMDAEFTENEQGEDLPA